MLQVEPTNSNALHTLSVHRLSRATILSAPRANRVFYFGDDMRFQSKPLTWAENENGCWICTSHACGKHGYPVRVFRGRLWYLSRIVWTQKYGEIPEKMCVCHRCDNPACIRVEHLFLGTHLDNMKDMISKARGLIGEKNGQHKLTADQVSRIRMDKRTPRIVSQQYSVSKRTIYDIKKRTYWKHVVD